MSVQTRNADGELVSAESTDLAVTKDTKLKSEHERNASQASEASASES